MNYTDLHYQTALGFLSRVGPKTAREIIEDLPELSWLFTKSSKQLEKLTRFKSAFFEQMERENALLESERVCSSHQDIDLQPIFFTQERFPKRLNHTPDGPLLIYSRGLIDFNNAKFISIVGTRNPSDYGHQVCRELVDSLRGLNVIIISGLAQGIDAFAHYYALENDIPTVAVLGHGLDRIYPSQNRAIAERILNAKGALITEFPAGTNPDRENFPKRNRIVAGMSDVTVVIESKEKGGSMITARLANDYNREVFAVPGNITKETSSGCNLLIGRNEAHIYRSPESLLETMGWKYTPKSNKQALAFSEKINKLTGTSKKITDCLASKGMLNADFLSLSTSIPIHEIQVELLSLELMGIVAQKPGNNYSIQT